MFIRIAALLTLLLVSANAYTLDTTSTTVYKKDFGIFVYGDIESIENAFVLVQAISTSSQLQTIIQLFMLFFLPYTAFKMVKTGTFKPLFANLTYVTASILTMSTATVPSCSIHIEDLRLETRIASLGLPSTTYAKVDNIPYPIALVTSTVSTITDSLTILYEDAIALLKPDLEGASSKAVGSGNAINDIMKILQTTAFNKLNDAESNLFVRSLSAYVSECGLKLATSKDPDLVINFTNPNKDLFKAIDPATLNITGSTYTLTFTDGVNGEKTYQCDAFWNNNIISKYDVIASKLQERVAKVLTGDITSSNVVTSYLTMAGSINDTVIAGNIGQMKATFMNLAAMSPISKAFANTSIDMSSGQDLANRITAGTSLAELEMNGAGQMRWVSEVLPYAYHYMLGIIYSISILIMIVATAMGYEKGFGVWKNFVKGLTTYELTKVSLVIVNSSVNQYTAKHAADFIASVGQNPVTISSIPYYYHYMATMAGIAGILGAIAVLSIPAMVFSGEVSTALGALGAITGRYKGNDVNTATEVTAEQKAKQEAYERELQDQAMLDRLGVSVPAGMGASEFYGLYKRGAEAMNANLGAQRLGTNAMADAGVAVKGQTIQGIAAGQALAGNTSMSEFALSGTSGGLRHSGGIKGEGNALVDFGGDAIALSAELGAYTQGAEGVMMTNARMNAGLAGSDGRLTNKALTSMSRRAGLESASLAGMADAKYTDKNGNSLSDNEVFALREKAASGQTAEAPLKDAAYTKIAMTENGSLNRAYASGLATSEEAKLASVRGVGGLSSSEQDRYVKASENASMIKTAQTIGDTEGQMKQYSDEAKKAGKELADVIRDVTNTVAQGKTGSTIGAINQVGSDAYIQNQITKAQSDTESLDRTIKRAGTPSNYINTNARQAAGQFGAMMDSMSEADKKYAGQGGYEGMLSINAKKQVDDGAATYEGEVASGKRNNDGSLTQKGFDAISKLSTNKSANEIKSGADRYTKEQADKDNAAYMEAVISAQELKLEKEQPKLSAEERKNLAFERAFNSAVATGIMNKDGSAVTGDARAIAYGEMAAGNVFGVAKGTDAHGNTISLNSGSEGSRVSSFEGGTDVNVANKKTSGEKTDTQNTTKHGSSYVNDQDKLQKVIAFNMHQVAHGHSDKQIKYDKASGSFSMPDKETEEDFKNFVGNSDLVSQTLKNVTSETLGEVADSLGMSPTAVVGAVGGGVLAGAGLALGKRLGLSGNKSIIDKTNNKSDHSAGKHVDSQHGDSFHDNIKNYTEEHGASKELFDKESRNLDNLKSQREHLDEMDPRQASRAHKLDEQILESEKKIAEHQRNMEIANSGVAKTQHSAGKEKLDPWADVAENPYKTISSTPIHDEINANRKAAGLEPLDPKTLHGTSHSKWGFLGKMATSVAASIGIANAGEFGETLENTMNAFDPISNLLIGQPLGAGSDTFKTISSPKQDLNNTPIKPSMVLHATNRVNEQHNIKEQPQDTNQEAMIDKKTLDDNKPLDTNTPHNTPIKPSMDLHATNGVSVWQKDTFLQNTLNAAQNDSGLAPAIDSYNASQNSLAMQQVQPNRITTMQTRGGEMSFVRNSKSGNLDVHLPGEPFAENSNIPFGEFQNIASNPQMAQQFAQMIAKSNFDGEGGGGIATATDMAQLKNEIDRNFQQNSIQTMNLRTSASMTAMELENTNEIIEEQVSTSIASVQDTLDDMKRQLER